MEKRKGIPLTGTAVFRWDAKERRKTRQARKEEIQ
jgi:hypothetical protein